MLAFLVHAVPAWHGGSRVERAIRVQRSINTPETSPAAVRAWFRRWRVALYLFVLLCVGLLARWAGERAAGPAPGASVAAHAGDD